jgi:hypothetical protein
MPVEVKMGPFDCGRHNTQGVKAWELSAVLRLALASLLNSEITYSKNSVTSIL